MKRIAYGALASLAVGCGAEVLVDLPAEEGSTSAVGTSTSQVGSGGATSTSSSSTAAGGNGGAGTCAGETLAAEFVKRPADILFVIDTSGSMHQEIEAVEQNINVNFASIIQASGIDYQVIMIAEHGSSGVCVGPPLSGTTDCNGPPVNVPGQFYHLDALNFSYDSACNILQGLEDGIGYNEWLREEAVKIFVEVSDDRMDCIYESTVLDDLDTVSGGQQAALAFDERLLDMSPEHFGTTAERNYLFFSIIGVQEKPNPLDAYEDDEGVVTNTCSSAVSVGTAYQWLSKGTGALRFPVCNTQSYDAVFQAIAAGVLEATHIPCEFELPEPPPGETLDLSSLDVLFTPTMGPPQSWTQVAGPSQCAPGAYYLQGTTVFLCPEACAVIEADVTAELEVSVGCL